jgi:hypothetical protein
MSKNIKRDERGCAILRGAKTFGGFTARPSSVCNRHFHLKEKAANKFARFVDAGQSVPPSISNEQMNALQEHNEFARLPHEVKLHYYHAQLIKVEEELEALESCGNERKIAFLRPAMEIQIEMFKQQMLEIYEEVKNEG